MKRLGTGALVIILSMLIPVEALFAGQADQAEGLTARAVVEQASSSSSPTDADAARTAAEELETLPEAAYQVDCRPNMRTLPPFTRFSRALGSPSALRILADGRCFFDPTASFEPIEPEIVEPAP